MLEELLKVEMQTVAVNEKTKEFAELVDEVAGCGCGCGGNASGECTGSCGTKCMAM